VGPVAVWSIRFQFGLLSYGFVLAWGYVHEYFTAVRRRDLAVARLEAELARAQLRALKAQLQPHFLFNTLHAVTVLISRDKEAAIRMVMRLSDLLRMTLVDAERQEAPLADELRFLRLYLEIEQTRFRERLEVVWDVPVGLERAAVPTLLLQPLVENALRHGIEATVTGGRLIVAAARSNGRLVLRVSNDGPGLGAPGGADGVGLASVRGRLERLYGGGQRFQLTEPSPGLVEASVELPFREFQPPEVWHA
jgi:LytS/YehU family sensor histidine kinase